MLVVLSILSVNLLMYFCCLSGSTWEILGANILVLSDLLFGIHMYIASIDYSDWFITSSYLLALWFLTQDEYIYTEKKTFASGGGADYGRN
mmetsp:Transcript_112149/g.241817  ORF Transcript_112149/g.241817 Transcript_112149/m.241817 type:complete len:91 (+) Transcript_112149:426-698(+)|eukprot:CAMPEP_0116918994 /NCGR_PEP_ID=MMETSP0467-20121206/20101_1 /TAXON_ID=283647 /ORGANISM="Mesodinium pulex, Strain SPMC105" /LENGTH=90 /DNA_ID=CAMNT_0004596447 /DNA_START=418 /DNA_END=690 /DNA_ORIENTATION=-